MPLRPCVWPTIAALAWILGGCHEIHFESHVVPGKIEIYDDLYSVSVPDDRHAVAVGYYGAIYQTENGGDRWFKRPSVDERLLYDVSMADVRRGWAVGQIGLIIHTDDGGETWTHQPTVKEKEGSHLFSVQAVDANSAWVIGEWGTRLYTDDGGNSWQDRSLTITTDHPQYVWLTPGEQERVRAGEMVFEDVTLNDIYCRPSPSERCWIVGEFGYIFWSDDHGRTWNRGEIVGTEKIEPIHFGYDETEFGESEVARIQDYVERILPYQHLNLLIEAFANEREVERFGHGEDPTQLFDILEARSLMVRSIIEETGILSDRLRMRGTPPWDYEDYIEEDPGFLDRYLEGQTTERPMVTVTVAQNPYLFRVRFQDDMNGLITGLGGVVLRSVDGGATWVYEHSDTRRALFAVSLHDDEAIATGEKGLIRVSSDAGRSWTPPAAGAFPEVFTYMRDIELAPGGEVGLIVGQRGLVLRSQDAGRTWEQVLPPTKLAAR